MGWMGCAHLLKTPAHAAMYVRMLYQQTDMQIQMSLLPSVQHASDSPQDRQHTRPFFGAQGHRQLAVLCSATSSH